MREHPESNPDELLELGLSKKAYQRLLEQEDPRQKTEVLQPVKVEQVKTERPKPNTVQMLNMRTGRTVRIGYKAARLLSNKYPKEFKIQ